MKAPDIVDELRAFEGSAALECGDFSILNRAVVEIERLRAEIVSLWEEAAGEDL